MRSLIAARLDARKAKDFKEGDRIRDELAAMGIKLKDAKDPATGEIVDDVGGRAMTAIFHIGHPGVVPVARERTVCCDPRCGWEWGQPFVPDISALSPLRVGSRGHAPG